MERLRLNSEADFKAWTDSLNNSGNLHCDVTYNGGYYKADVPTSYPCIVAWHEWDISGSRHDGGCHTYFYPTDFNQ